MNKKFSTKQIVTGGVLLALMISSMFLKNLSVYITGPIVNLVLIIATLSLGLVMGIILSVLAPVFSFIITASPIIAGIPLILPAIALGNIVLCCFVHIFYKRFSFKFRLPLGLAAGSVFKAAFMGAVIVNCLLPLFSSNIAVPEAKLPVVLATARTSFGITQLFTALIASVLAVIIWPSLKKVFANELSEN